MMTDEKIYELATIAFQKNEVTEFLSGKNGYACPVDKYVPANVPTDFSRILSKGIYALYQNGQKDNLIKKYKEAILALTNMTDIDLWIAFSICWVQLYNEKRSAESPAPFNIIDQSIIDSIARKLIERKSDLSLNKEWQGWNLDEGLWGDIEIQNRKSIQWFGVSFV